jgi:bacterioferritin-associated ferredoxin
MLVCHCNGVSDRTVRRVVREGAVTTAEVGRVCGAGTCCRGCTSAINRIIRSESHGEAQASANLAQATASATS